LRNNDDYFNDEEFQEILNDYESSVKSGNAVFMDADDLTEIAEYYQQNERYDEAREALDRAVEINPNALGVLDYQIHEALQNGNIEAAQQYLDSIMERESPEYIYSRAEILIAQEKIDEADEYLREQLQDMPPDEYQDYVLDVANIYTDYGFNDKAMEWMMRAKHENTDDFKELMARTLFGLGKYDDSERLFNELIDRDPFQKRYWNALASTQYMKEDFSGSVTSSEYAIAIDPDDPEAVIAKANALCRLENYEEALSYYERYSRLEPDDEFGLLHQGTCLINLNRFEEAIERLQKAIDVAPADSDLLVEIYEELGFAYSELRQPDKALYYIDLTDELECDHDDMLVIKGHILLANNRLEDAETMFKKALQQTNNDPKIMLRILVSLYDNKYVEAAHTMFQKFFTIVDDDWTDGYAYMALCCWDTQRIEEFMKYLYLACKKNPQEARMVLSGLFPEGVAPKDYYSYMLEKIKQ
jgi:tetratricopeptide (TPR) repeat protein